MNKVPIPILSPNPSPCREAATPPERKRKEADTQTAFEIYREIIKENISYDILMQEMKFDGDRLNEIVDLMLETVCTRRKTIRIAGDDYPAELVKAKFMKLDSEHILFDLASYYGGLHCGDCFDVFIRGKWKPTRIEMNMKQEWYLVGIRADDLNGLRVHI